MDKQLAMTRLAILHSKLQRSGLPISEQIALASDMFSSVPGIKEAFDTVSATKTYVDDKGVTRTGQDRKTYVFVSSHIKGNANLTLRFSMSNAKPYWDSPIVRAALQGVEDFDRKGPLRTPITDKKAREANSKRCAFAMLNHYYTLDMGLLVSGEQERWPLQNGKTEKGYDTGPYIPDMIVEGFATDSDGDKFCFSDLIFCEVKRKDPDVSFAQVHLQVSLAARNHMSQNEHVFACIIWGTKASFFALYDVETADFTHNNLHPIWPYPPVDPQILADQGVTLHRLPNDEIYAYEVDMLKVEHRDYIHNTFITMSSVSGPVDPRVLIPFFLACLL